MNHLFVSECFYSIQGEGSTTGVPSVFLRLSGCNLLCQSESWVCDSIDVWKKGVKTDFIKVANEYISRLENRAHLVITGGEPLMHQKKIIDFLNWFSDFYGFKPFVEVETNGTILPFYDFNLLVDKWNVSPKLSSSGEKKEKRFKEGFLRWFCGNPKTTFKFVVSGFSDWTEITKDFSFISKDKIILMPAGETQKKLDSVRKFVVEMCLKEGVRFSDRLHITIWNKKTGV